MAEIHLSGINKVYADGTHAVHDVDLHIADGEFLIMVGPSGCAKSTILRMIAGLETPTSGDMVIDGQRMNDVAPKDRDIAMVFQSYALYPHMSVYDNMAFGLRLRKMSESEIQQRIGVAARTLGIEALLDRKPKAMSGGQRQRVAMGRAIVREPRAFLMDEPLSNLDAKLRVQVRTQIAKLHAQLGITTVYVTHDQVEAMTLGQRICVLRKGVVQQVDTPYEVYTNPSNVFVAGFIGSPSMNFVMAQVIAHGGQLHLQVGEHVLPLPQSVADRLLPGPAIEGQTVIMGFRPEHMHEAAPGHPATVHAHVDLVETMGSEAYAYFAMNVRQPDLSSIADAQQSGDETFVAKLPSTTNARRGEPLVLGLQMEHVHLFDPSSLVTLLAPLAPGTVVSAPVEPQVAMSPAAALQSAAVAGTPIYEPAPAAVAAMAPPADVAAYGRIAAARTHEQAAPSGHDFPRPRLVGSIGAEAAAEIHAANPGFRARRADPAAAAAPVAPVIAPAPADEAPQHEVAALAQAATPVAAPIKPRLPAVDTSRFDELAATPATSAAAAEPEPQRAPGSRQIFRGRPLFG